MPLNERQKWFIQCWRDESANTVIGSVRTTPEQEREADAVLWLDIVDTLAADLEAERKKSQGDKL
jgi:hypothetical protein